MTGTLPDSQHTLTLFDVLVSICSLRSPGSLGCTRTGSPIVNHVGPSTSHRQGHNMASAMPADSSENLQPSQRNDGPEPARIARDCSLQTTRGKYSRRGTCDMFSPFAFALAAEAYITVVVADFSLKVIVSHNALLCRWNKEAKLFMPSHSRRFESHIDCRLVYVARFRITTILASDWSIPWLL